MIIYHLQTMLHLCHYVLTCLSTDIYVQHGVVLSLIQLTFAYHLIIGYKRCSYFPSSCACIGRCFEVCPGHFTNKTMLPNIAHRSWTWIDMAQIVRERNSNQTSATTGTRQALEPSILTPVISPTFIRVNGSNAKLLTSVPLGTC